MFREYIAAFEAVRPSLCEFIRNPNGAQLHDHNRLLEMQMSNMLNQLQNLVPPFVHNYLRKWKLSEIVDPYKTAEENSKMLEFTRIYFEKLLQGVELLLKAYKNNPQAFQNLQNLKCQLLENALVVIEQPPHAIKQATNFKLGVKFLAGGVTCPSIDIDRGQAQAEGQVEGQGQLTFKMFLISEKDVEKLYESQNQTGHPCPLKSLALSPRKNIMSNNNAIFDGNEYIFRALKIDKLHRPNNRGAGKGAHVLDTKSVLLITTTVEILGEFKEIWAISVPVVFMTSRLQECGATATFFWDNYFREKNRIPFQVMENVRWDSFKMGLNAFFKTATGTSRDLTNDDLKYIGMKIFEKDATFERDNSWVKRVEFCSAKYDSKRQEFELNPWTWLYFIVELIANHLKEPWNTGAIRGFVDRTVAEKYVLAQGPGTFLLRFSDSKLGGITISACKSSGISSVDPILSEGLKTRSIERRLGDLKDHQNVVFYDQENKKYGIKAKEDAFLIPPPPTATPLENGRNGKKPYDPEELVMRVIDKNVNTNTNTNRPTTGFASNSAPGAVLLPPFSVLKGHSVYSHNFACPPSAVQPQMDVDCYAIQTDTPYSFAPCYSPESMGSSDSNSGFSGIGKPYDASELCMKVFAPVSTNLFQPSSSTSSLPTFSWSTASVAQLERGPHP